MFASHVSSTRRGAYGLVALAIALGVVFTPASDARAATILTGPLDLGDAESFALLGGTAITNTGPSVLDGDVGLHPGTSIGVDYSHLVAGSGNDIYGATDNLARDAKTDLRGAMTTAAGLTPTVSGLANLTSMALGPGVYSGGALSLDGAGVLTLVGDQDSVWVFTAASTLITGTDSRIVMSGVGASECNVYWLVGSSATFGTRTSFIGTVMAEQSITANTDTAVIGRLLASNAAVTLDSTDITVPTSCDPPVTPIATGEPEITSGIPTDATEGEPYSFAFTAIGDLPIDYAVTDGVLPDGLVLDSTTGILSGTPLDSDDHTFTVTASNGTTRTASVIARLTTLAAAAVPAPGTGTEGVTVAALLPPTGLDLGSPILPVVVVTAGAGLIFIVARRRQSRLR